MILHIIVAARAVIGPLPGLLFGLVLLGVAACTTPGPVKPADQAGPVEPVDESTPTPEPPAVDAPAASPRGTAIDTRAPKYVALMNELHTKHGFARTELERLFAQARFLPDVPQKFAKPAELLPYNQYRQIFITPEHVASGRSFLARNKPLLDSVEQQYGVDAPVIAAILSVETKFGKRPDGGFLVFDALNSTFTGVPTREGFARKELIEFLLLCRDEHLDPLAVKGSYAGAMGAPQFIASSYRAYAVDFDQDGRRDLWRSDGDIFGSVANYLKQHGWQKGAPIRLPVTADGKRPEIKALLTQGTARTTPLERVLGSGIAWAGTPGQPGQPGQIDGNPDISLLIYPTDDGEQTAALFPNFRAILTYNHAVNYALVVSELAELIAQPQPATDGKPDQTAN
ncbi:MAG: lytic murein transglycosylase [Nitrospirae bacterium]|nr:lytic murein transglycosylase [Nitrospirota bacterium]